MKILFAFIFLFFCAPALYAQGWPPEVERILKLAQQTQHFEATMALKPDFHVTSDQRSYFISWKPQDSLPDYWLVTLHGSNDFATSEVALWAPHLAPRNIGIIALQWWLGTNNSSYYLQNDIYRELDLAIQKLGITGKRMMLHGFSRGSSNIYAVKAMDIAAGRHYFPLIVANSGGAAMDYPPNKEIVEGRFGARPFTQTRWITVCGIKDQRPDRDGCPAMRRTAEWVQEQGGDVILSIEDEKEGHGALHRNPDNAEKVLDTFLSLP